MLHQQARPPSLMPWSASPNHLLLLQLKVGHRHVNCTCCGRKGNDHLLPGHLGWDHPFGRACSTFFEAGRLSKILIFYLRQTNGTYSAISQLPLKSSYHWNMALLFVIMAHF